jgi:hypothetical protein
MTDATLHQLLVALLYGIDAMPRGEERRDAAERFMAVVVHLESKGLIPRGQWTIPH